MQIGPYRIEGELGRGGAGIVYRALGPQGAVALKLLGGQSEAAFARFQREVQLQAELTGAGGFVPVLDAGRSPRGPYLVMPLLPGGTLRQRLRASPRGLPLTEILDLGEALASALGRAHASGLVHRDLKPENVLFDHLGCPLIADLGLAKAMEATDPGSSGGLSKTGELRGTLGYMPLEQIEDSKRASPSSDVFALGAILYECATGVAAFSGQGALDLMDAIRAGRYEDPRSLRPELSKPLARLIRACLSTDPAARPPDGRALSRALETLGLGRRRAGKRALTLAVVAVAGVAAALLGYQAIRSGAAPQASVSRAASPASSSTPASPSPSLPRPSLPSPSLPSPLAPTPSPTRRTPPTWVKPLQTLGKELDKLQSVAIVEELGTGAHRTTTPVQAMFLVEKGSQLAVWDEDFLWTYALPDLRLLRSTRLAFADLAERRDPDCVRVLDPSGRSFVSGTAAGAFVHSEDQGIRVTLSSRLAAAAFFSPFPLAALASGKKVALLSLPEREVVGTLGHKEAVVALETTPGSNRLLSATSSGKVHLWELGAEGRTNEHKGLVTTLAGARHLALGPKADTWAVASPTQVRVHRFSGGRLLNVNLGQDEAPTSIRISADGELLLILSEGLVVSVSLEAHAVARKTKIFPTRTSVLDGTGDRVMFAAKNSPHLLRSIHLPSEGSFRTAIGHVGAIRAIAHAPQGVVAGDDAGGHSYWSRGECRFVRLTPGPISGILHLQGRTLITRTGHPSTTAKLEDGSETEPKGQSTFVAQAPHGQSLVGEKQGAVRVLRNDKQVQRWALHQGPVLGARLLPDRYIASWAAGESELLISRAGKVSHRLTQVADEVVDVAPLRDGALAIGLRSGQVLVYELSSDDSRLLVKTTAARAEELTCLAGHRSGRLLLTGDRSGAVRIFRWKSGELKLREEIDLKEKGRDFLTYASQGETLDDIYFGTARGVILLGRWLPVRDK